MLHISLFSGIGGFDLASEWMGWTNIASCEINPFGRKVLEYYWPNAYHHDDIKTLTYTKLNEELTKKHGADWRADDIVLTGGFPCQPYSVAGQRKGKEDERHLWSEMLRAIREIAPSYVVGENVRGLLSWNGGMVFDEVCADLEALGYTVTPCIIPAVGVNAPHKRERIWFIAYRNGARFQEARTELTATRIEQHGELGEQPTTHANNTQGGGRLGQVQGENGEVPERHNDAKFGNASNERDATDSNSGRLEGSTTSGRNGKYVERQDGNNAQANQRTTTDTERIGHTRRTETPGNDNAERIGGMDENIGQHGNEIRSKTERCGGVDAKNTNGIGQEWWLHTNKPENAIRKQFSESNARTDKWGTWENFPIEPPICSRNDGISSKLDGITFSKWRNESIKAGGNAIVPQVAYQIFKTIQQIDNDTRNHI